MVQRYHFRCKSPDILQFFLYITAHVRVQRYTTNSKCKSPDISQQTQESRSVYHSKRKSPRIPHQMQESRYTTAFARVQIRSVCTTNAGVHIYHTSVTECILCVQGHDPLIFSFLSSFLFFDWVGVLWPQLSKVLKPVHWASSVRSPPPPPPPPPVSLQRQVVCLLLRPVFMCSSQRRAYTVSWLV